MSKIGFGLAVAGTLIAVSGLRADGPAAYRRIQLSTEFFCEGSTFADLNRDGHPDAIAGPYWYEGPDFTRRHEIYPAQPFDPLKYSDNFMVFAHDFNGDGWPDVLVIGFPGLEATWFENPGAAKPAGFWRRHPAYMPVDNESATLADITRSGRPAIICSSGGKLGYATFDPRDPTRMWTFHAISPAGPYQRFTHGLGVGDINGDGRPDLIERDGWWEQPALLQGDPIWKKHPFRFGAGRGGAQMAVADLNGDGLADVVTSLDAHGYGLSWFEQRRVVGANGSDEAISFVEHPILSAKPEEKLGGVQFSQLHALTLADVDGDGLSDIIVGKRWWAHGPKIDPDPLGPAVLYAFLLRRENHVVHFEPRLLDSASGVGVQVTALDINQDGRADIISANKRGTVIFLSQ